MQEAGTSITFKMLNPAGVEFMITLREPGEVKDADKACFERAYAISSHAIEKGWTPLMGRATQHAAQTAPAQVAPANHPPATQPQGQPQNGGALTFTADTLTVEFNAKGEKTAKLKGGAFAKFGVRLWPEVAAQLGFDLNQHEAGDYRIQPMPVVYVNNNEGKPSKITGRA